MRRNAIILLASLALIRHSQAEVVLDGTLGPPGALSGPNFFIEPKLGQQMGGNLFHSFARFNLNSSESATFTGPASIHNVISRVTGGQASTIDGLLRSQIPNADMYFLNPAGVMFGPNAQIDVPASLYISSADSLKLGDSGRFEASAPDNSLLTVAPPSAFGFLNSTPARITVEGSQLKLKNEEKFARRLAGEDVPLDTFALVGGDITLKDSQLITYGNAAHFISVASAGEAPINPTDFTENRFAAYGTLSITDATTSERLFGNIDASGPGGGAVFIRAGRFVLDRGWLFADTWGQQAGRGMTIHAKEALTLQDGARITTEVYDFDLTQFGKATGNGGRIAIETGDLSLTGGSQIASTSRSSGAAGNLSLTARHQFSLTGYDRTGQFPSAVLSDSFDTGAAGEITIAASQLKMDDAAQMRAYTQGLGDAGKISLQVETLEILGGAQITVGVGRLETSEVLETDKVFRGSLSITAADAVLISGKTSKITASTMGTGPGGEIKLTAPQLRLTEGGYISANSLAQGDAGRIVLNLETLQIQAGSVIESTTQDSGAGGNIEILAAKAVLIQGEQTGITAESLGGVGQGGNVQIQTGQLQLTDKAGISVSALGASNAGHIVLILAEQLQVQAGSLISANTGGAGAGGTIDISAPVVTLENSGAIRAVTGYDGRTITDGSGKGGDVTLRANQLQVINGSSILTNSFGKGEAGDIVLMLTETLGIHGNNARIAASSQGTGQGGNLKLEARQLQLTDNGHISASSIGTGDAGSMVLILADKLDMQDGSSIQTSTIRADGGNIEITVPKLLYLSHSEITTSVKGGGGDGGNITLENPVFVILKNSQVKAQAYGGRGGNIRLTSDQLIKSPDSLVSASSKLGIDGDVNIDSPAVNMDEFLLVLQGNYIEGADLPMPCQINDISELSTFRASTASEGMPKTPKDYAE